MQVSSRTASAVLAVQCQQTVADEHEGQHNAVQLVFDVWHKPAQTFKDQVHRRCPHLCSMKARAIIWPLPVWRSYFRGMIRSKWCVVPFTRRWFDAYSILRAEGSSSFASESDPRTVALTDGRRWRQTTWLS